MKHPAIHIDLASPVIKTDQPVYMLHPGKGYHLFGSFLSNSVVATDLPNLDIKDGIAPLRADNIDAQISRSRALRDWLALNESQRSVTKYDVDLSSYLNSEKRRYHDDYLDHLQELLWNLPSGAVIFVPAADLSMQGFFCELKSNSAPRVKFHGPGRAKAFTYLGRPVDNIKQVDMRLIPADVLNAKTRHSVLTDLDHSLSERMYRLYYGSFIISGGIHQIEVDVPSKTFRPGDANIVNALANMVEDNLQKALSKKKDVEGTSLPDAAFMTFDNSELQMHARLNSEGVLQIAAKSIAPLLVSILMSLAGQATPQEMMEALKNTQITVTNSKCPTDGTLTNQVKTGLYSVMEMMGEDNLEDVCKRVSALKDRTNVKTDARVQVQK